MFYRDRGFRARTQTSSYVFIVLLLLYRHLKLHAVGPFKVHVLMICIFQLQCTTEHFSII